MIKQFNRFLFFVFVFGCYASANFLKASSEDSVPNITVETADQIPLSGGSFTFNSIILPSLNEFPMALIALANGLKRPTGTDSWESLPDDVPIYTEFSPANGFDGTNAYPTTIYLPGSAGVKQSEENEIARLNAQGEHVFAIKTNFSHVKYIGEKKGVSLTKEEIQNKASTSKDQLKANPLNQVADVMRLLKILHESPIVDSNYVTVMGSSLGGVSAALCALPEFAGPLSPGAFLVNNTKGKLDHDYWVGIPKFNQVVAIGPLLAIMPQNPLFDKRVITFIGQEDNFCDPWSNIHVLQKGMKSFNVSLEILQGVGHFPEGSKKEYEARVKSSKSGGIVYREEEKDYFIKRGQNISKACFRLGQKISFFKKREEEDMNEYMGRIEKATFVLHGKGPWDEGEEKSLMVDFVQLHKLITQGTSIKPDLVATEYIHSRTNELKDLSNREFRSLAREQYLSIQDVKTKKDMEDYDGFVPTDEMLRVSRGGKLDEDNTDKPFR